MSLERSDDMKRPTLKELIEAADNQVFPAEWIRRDLMKTKFEGLSDSTLNNYQKEMDNIPEFKSGIMRPSHSISFINIHAFVWYLKWKEANRYRTKKISPKDILKEEVYAY